MKVSSIVLVIVAILAMGAFFVFGYMTAREVYGKPPGQADTVFVEKWVHDTIREPRDSVIYKTKIAYLPVHDTTEVHDTTFVHDSVLVEIPIWQKTYVGPNYKAVVSGYDPKLVDIWIRQQETIVNVPYRKRWGFSLGAQVGYGITLKGWQPYLGFGGTFGYNF